MTPWMTTIVAVALTGLALLSVYQLFRAPKHGPFLFSLAVLAGIAWLLRRFFGFPTAQPITASKSLTPSELAQLDVPRVMVFLVAFENGFFWKEYFDNRRKRSAQ